MRTPKLRIALLSFVLSVVCLVLLRGVFAVAQKTPEAGPHLIVLHAARMLDIEAGKIVAPGELLVEGDKIVEAGTSVPHPAGAEAIDLGDIDVLEEDVTPMTCCGLGCSC